MDLNKSFSSSLLKSVYAFFFSKKGVFSVEFAIYAPLFLLTLILCVAAIKVQAISVALEQSLYAVAQKTKIHYGASFQEDVDEVFEEKLTGFFTPEYVTITPTFSHSLTGLATIPADGPGIAESFVCLDIKANIDLFPFFGSYFKVYNYSNKYCFQNEIQEFDN